MWEDTVEFFKIIGKLKKLKRAGWIQVGMKNPESVSEHSFRTAVLAMVIADIKNLDKEKMMKMALLHDLEEAFIGDLTPYDKQKIKKEDLIKSKKEAEKKIMSFLPKNLQEKYSGILKEHHENKTEEAKIFKQIDRLELAMQASEYEKDGYDKKKLDEFWTYVEKSIDDKDLKKIFEILEKERASN